MVWKLVWISLRENGRKIFGDIMVINASDIYYLMGGEMYKKKMLLSKTERNSEWGLEQEEKQWDTEHKWSNLPQVRSSEFVYSNRRKSRALFMGSNAFVYVYDSCGLRVSHSIAFIFSINEGMGISKKSWSMKGYIGDLITEDIM